MTDTASTVTTTEVQWGFEHPGWSHLSWSEPHIETQYTGADGWTTGPYTEENVRYHAGGRRVVKRTRTTTITTTDWEEVPRMINFAIHTPTPILPLTMLVADSALIVQEGTYQGKTCCFYGWGEPMADAITCKPHHVVSSEDSDTIHHLAASLVALGYEAVVTSGEPDGDHEVINGAPFLYNQTHQH